MQEKYYKVLVNSYDGKDAYCNVLFNGRWLPITLERKSLEQIGIEEGDTFEWTLEGRGRIVNPKDIRKQPKDLSHEEIEEIEKTFKKLRKSR